MKRLICIAILWISTVAHANSTFMGNDGYRLWMQYDLLSQDSLSQQYTATLSNIILRSQSDTAAIIRQELILASNGLLAITPSFGDAKAKLVISTQSQLTKDEAWLLPKLKDVNKEGFVIVAQNGVLYLSAHTDIGLLYGSYHLIRLMQTKQALTNLNISQSPKVALRMLNHWDDLDRHTERGYAGESIFDWHKLPEYKEQRYYDYARANASLGINGIVPINVNSDALVLTPQYLEKVKALADIFRPYGIKVYLSLKFSAPAQLSGLANSDPLNKDVQRWWQQKSDEIYRLIPDFGGYLVKANSEGQPGPGDYGRSHADGANMLANTVKKHGGVVLWRAFVYSPDTQTERSLQAYNEFVPLDGQFADNVIIQVKNGPIDFQPREPFSPMFGAMPQTPLAMEFQITQEYLGFSTHLAYLGTLFEEVLDTDTYVAEEGATVASVIDGSLHQHELSVVTGVANIGTDRNWTGHIFGQANWYSFGRLAWDHQLSAKQIAQEWIAMTLSRDKHASESILKMMMDSREHVVNYMTPLGLHHLMDTGHHYGPGPWVDDLGRDDWNPTYYHRATEQGIGIDRTASGTNGVSQYSEYWQKRFASPSTTPQPLLLWFHHLSWDYVMPSGNTLWYELAKHYDKGVQGAKNMQSTWESLKGKIDPNQFRQVQMALSIQVKEAKWWRDACMLYFQSISKKPFPKDFTAPDKSLEYFQSLQFPYAPGQG